MGTLDKKFEEILKKLYWFDATVYLITENFGEHKYEWIMKIENYKTDEVRPTTDWIFKGGRMEFTVRCKEEN